MAGYRDTSNFDPMPSSYGPPLRPYNKVQWIGAAMQLIAAAGYGYYIAQQAGWVPDLGFNTMMIALPFLLFGMTFVYSRRQEPVDLAPELAAQRKRWMFITVAISALIIGTAIVLDYYGIGR